MAHNRLGHKEIDQYNSKGKKNIPLTIKLVDTGEVFSLNSVTPTMTVVELKSYLEFVTGIPVILQRLHYLDETELQDHTDIKSNDIVSGGQLHMTIWHTWLKLVKAVTRGNTNEVLKLGVTAGSEYRTPNSDHMNSKGRQQWLAERAFVALFIASHRGHTKLVQALVDTGADVNSKTKHGRTALHVSAAQGNGDIVDILLNKGADVNEIDKFGDTALAIAERFGHKDGARQLFLFRWQVRAAKAEKMPQKPLYYHQQCDTANPVWLSGTQGQLYYASKDKFVDEYAGSGLGAAKATDRFIELSPDQRVKSKISHDDWLMEKIREEETINAAKKAEKAAKKLEEEKKKEQYLIDKESYDTWVRKQQEQKERQLLQKKLVAQANKQKQAAASKDQSNKLGGSSSVRTSDNFENEKDAGSNLNELLSHMKTSQTVLNDSDVLGQYVSYDGLVFQNEYETFDKVKSIQLKRAADKKNISIIPML